MSQQHSSTSRRTFLKTTAAATGALLATGGVHGAGSDTIKVGLIGCGGRGSGAVEDVLRSAPGVEIVSLGDYFKPQAVGLGRRLNELVKSDDQIKKLGNKAEVPEERCFSGLDAYEKVINTAGVNYVILATPPGFRPIHIQAAIAAGKNLFTEKPVGVDGPGIRKVLEAYEEANKKKLGVAAGTQRRHQFGYLETIKAVQQGEIGDIVTARCYWNQGDIWFRNRRPDQSDLDYQVYNWYHFLWLCGDHICEQHVHNLDVVNWALGNSHPIRALGMGGRTRKYENPNVDGNIFNFFAIEYEYPNNVHVQSMCRQIGGTDGNLPGSGGGVSEALVGTKGVCQVNAYTINGKPVVRRQQARLAVNPYVQEHTDLIESIRNGKPINELKNVAESTLTAIMGRMSAYTGKAITWEQALNSKLDTLPQNLSADMKLEAAPLPVPGKTPLS